jgi:hypothetical protein
MALETDPLIDDHHTIQYSSDSPANGNHAPESEARSLEEPLAGGHISAVGLAAIVRVSSA